MKPPIIGITLGDPAGIGPEVILRALSHRGTVEGAQFLLYAAPDALEQAWIPARTRPDEASIARAIIAGRPDRRATLVPITVDSEPDLPLTVGRFDPRHSPAVLATLTRALEDAVRGRIAAVVTGPINKAVFTNDDATMSFPGQSEFFAHHTNTTSWAMMLAGERLRVVLVTTHLPLAAVPDAITRPLIEERAGVALTFLADRLGLARPRLGIAALNPHAGEGGLMGHHEARVIAPAVERLRAKGHDVQGPLPADTLFGRAADGHFDCVLAMYHDQGLIPLKLIEFGNAVNVTLGLPIIRTSPDHGVAYDIAGRGQANPGAMMAAIQMARLLGSPQTP